MKIGRNYTKRRGWQFLIMLKKNIFYVVGDYVRSVFIACATQKYKMSVIGYVSQSRYDKNCSKSDLVV